MFHKEGYRIIAVTFIVVAVIFLSAHYFINTAWLTYSLWSIGFVFLALILQFFRNPKRNFIPNDKRVLSPVDGKVVVIEEVFEPEELPTYKASNPRFKKFKTFSKSLPTASGGPVAILPKF